MNANAAESASRRPRTLCEVAQWGAAQGHIDAFLSEFVDEFNAA